MSDSPKYRASIVNFKTVTESAESQDQAIRAIQDGVRELRLQGMMRQVEANVLAVSNGSTNAVRHFVYRSGETTPIEVKPIRETSDHMKDQASIEDVLKVGPDKPLGYAIVSDPTRLGSYTIESLTQELEGKGLKVALTRDPRFSDHLFMNVYHEIALQKLLDKHRDVLKNAGWPETAGEFVLKVFTEQADAYTDLFTLTADAFADYTNSGRVENVIGVYNK